MTTFIAMATIKGRRQSIAFDVDMYHTLRLDMGDKTARAYKRACSYAEGKIKPRYPVPAIPVVVELQIGRVTELIQRSDGFTTIGHYAFNAYR